ncbi:hypothetical protein [Croceibacterium aestuarii]|uniref:hypothetical protein n=1 Tax=Croceibacterium aestuarii TaxID=3064139 RepID=UPI00272E5819|nr:hypothetical protein [Croceibacterium sp. D39]
MLLAAAPLGAQTPPLALESAVFVERGIGAERTVEPSVRFTRGERVVTVMRWDAPRGNYTVTSAVPARLQFERASSDRLEVSIDGGRTWRGAAEVQPEAVTHLRWRIGAGSGRLSYSAIVR